LNSQFEKAGAWLKVVPEGTAPTEDSNEKDRTTLATENRRFGDRIMNTPVQQKAMLLLYEWKEDEYNKSI